MLLRAGPRPLVARLTRAELARVTDILDEAVAAWQRDDYSRIRLGTALREAIGRDPFRSPDRDGDRSFLPWWRAGLYLVFGVGFAVRHFPGWLQLAGWGMVAVVVTDLVQRARWWRRRRLR